MSKVEMQERYKQLASATAAQWWREDTQYMDLGSESEYVTTPDIDFIDPREDFHEIKDYDPSYNDPDKSLSIWEISKNTLLCWFSRNYKLLVGYMWKWRGRCSQWAGDWRNKWPE
jgi:hypothetical protein